MPIARAHLTCLALGLLAAGGGVAAGEPLILDESAWTQDLPVVLTPSRLPRSQQDAPAAITVIDRELIEATGYQDLPRLLRLIPGMQVGQERANTHWVTYHGLSNDFPSEMQVLIDGVSIFSPAAFGGVDWSSRPITVDEIERIEVVRGTDPVGFGSNAFLGVINIITRAAAASDGSSARIAAGTQGYRSGQAIWSTRTPDGGLRLTGSARRDDGFADLHDTSRSADVSLAVEHRLSLRDELSAHLAYRTGERDAGYPDSLFDNNAQRTDAYRAGIAQLQWRHSDSPESDWLINLFHNRDTFRDEWFATTTDADLPGRPATRVPLDRNRRSTRSGAELQRRQPVNAELGAVWGAELRRDVLDASFFFFGQGAQKESLARLFGSLEWAPGSRGIYHAGLLAEKVSHDAMRFAPRVFGNWHASPTHTLRAGYARGWRQRNLFEVNGDIRAIDPNDEVLLVQPYRPNPELRRSRIDTVELGWLAHLLSIRSIVDARLFNERIRDFVVREATAVDPATPGTPLLGTVIPPSHYVNLATPVTLRGLEYELRFQPDDDTTVLLTHTMIDRRSDDAAVRERTAPYTATLSWIAAWPCGWQTTLTLLRQGPLAGGDGFVPGFRYVAAPYTTADARIAWHGRWVDRKVEVALTGTNLGGRHQEVSDRSEQLLHPTHPVNETSPQVALSIKLQLD